MTDIQSALDLIGRGAEEIIKREELEHKYRHEIHANELVLLAYYIAAIIVVAT